MTTYPRALPSRQKRPVDGVGESERQRRNAQTAARKATLERRKQALRNACEGLFVARGWGIRDAERMASWWVADKLDMARKVMGKYGFDYWTSEWRAS